MNKSAVFVLFAFTISGSIAMANYEVERLMDSYVLAKADSEQFPLSESELKDTPYTIQVASYINEKDAVSHVEELKLQEKDVLYFPAFVRGQVWFKVCVGKFAKKDKAEAYRKSFIKRMDEPFAVVISLLDRPKPSEKPEDKATAAVPAKNSIEPRAPANVAIKESEKVPLVKTSKPSHAPMPEVKLMPKVKEPAAKISASHLNTNSYSHKYSLQIGAYDKESIVKAKIDSMSTKDLDVYYMPATVNGKQWYRLFVGKFETKAAAESYQKKYLEKTEGADAFIRRVPASE